MMSINEIAALAKERAQKGLEEHVSLHACFSGVNQDRAKMSMIVEYYSTLWNEMVSLAKEQFPAKETKQSLDMLLLELHKRGVKVQPSYFHMDTFSVEIGDTWYELRESDGEIYVDKLFSPKMKISLDEAAIGDLLLAFTRTSNPLPEIYEDVCRRLQLEQREHELQESTAKGLVQDILKSHKADLSFEGVELKFTLTKGGVTKRFRSCMGLLRDDLFRALIEIQRHEDYLASKSKSTDNDET